MQRRTRNTLIASLGLVVAIVVTLKAIEIHGNPDRVAYILNIASLPKSLRVLECESGPPTDIVITCAIEIEPQDFPLLLKGYQFSKLRYEGTSYALDVPKVGAEFPVAIEYCVRPVAFKDGGSVKVFVDKENKHAVIDLYIE